MIETAAPSRRGKTLSLGLALVLSISWFYLGPGSNSAEGAAAGDFDTTFGSGGFAVDDFSTSNLPDFFHAVVLYPPTFATPALIDDIVSTGFADDGNGNLDFSVSRRNSNGTLDTAFGGDGRVTTGIGPANDTSQAAVIQPDGKVVVAGFSDDASGNFTDFSLARFNTNGDLDSTFGIGGTTMTAVSPYDDEGRGVGLQSDGKILVGGFGQPIGTDFDLAVARYDSSGLLDPSYGGGDGIAVLDVGGEHNKAYGMAVDTLDRVILVGYTKEGAAKDFLVARFDTNGDPDTSFSGDGVATLDMGGEDQANAVTLQSNGNIIVAGNSGGNYGVARFEPDGDLDLNFDSNGWLTTGIGNFNDEAWGVQIDNSGKLVLSGFSMVAASGGTFQSEISLLRLNLDNGAFDTSFGGDGKVITALGDGSDRAFGLVVQPDTKIIVVGETTNTSSDSAVIRFLGLTAQANDLTVSEGDSGSQIANFPVTLSAPAVEQEATVTVTYTISAGSASLGSDFTVGSSSGTLVFNPGVSSLNVPVSIIGDTVEEPDETINITLNSAENASIFDATGVMTIIDNEFGRGYWMVASDGGIFAFGDAPFHGSMGGRPLAAPVVGMSAPANSAGYWLVARDGGIFAFNVPFYGSMGGRPLAAPVVGMAALPNGSGYYLVGSDGGIFAFNAPFHGSMGGRPLAAPIVGMAVDPDGDGYWLVASDGGIFAFNAPFLGSMGGQPLARPVVGMSSHPNPGYWLVASDGGIFAFNAPFLGSMGGQPLARPVVGMDSRPLGTGYWLAASDGGIFAFPDAGFYGSMGGIPLAAPVVGLAATG